MQTRQRVGNGEPFREKVCSEDLVDQKRRKSAPGSPDSGYELVRHFSSNPDSLWNSNIAILSLPLLRLQL